jgi:hypothetical protein
MKTYQATFQPKNSSRGNYTDTIQAPFKWLAWLILKRRNSAKMSLFKVQTF